jgi:hypothetical protein
MLGPYGCMRSAILQLYQEYSDLIRLLNGIYYKIQNSFNLIQRVRWKIHWEEIRDSCVLRLGEDVANLMRLNECSHEERQLLSLTLNRIDEGFVRESSYSEKDHDSFIPRSQKLSRIREEEGSFGRTVSFQL